MFNPIPNDMCEVEAELKTLCTKIVAGTHPQLVSVLFDENADRKRYKLRMIMSMCDIIDKMNAQEINASEEEYIVGMLDDAIKTNSEEYITAFKAPKIIRIETNEDIDSIVDADVDFNRNKLYRDGARGLWCYDLEENGPIQISDSIPVPEIVDYMRSAALSGGKDLKLRSVLSAILAIEKPND